MKKNALLAFILTLLLSGVARTSVSVDVVEASMAQEAAPDFTLTDIDGNAFSLSDYRGIVVLLEFFAMWCSPCVNQTAHLKILYEEFGEKLVIISISRENETVQRDFRQHGIEWTIASDTANVSEVYEVHAIPTLVIIDQQGYICYTHVRLTEESVLRPEIESLLPRTIYVDNGNVEGPWNGTKEHPYQNITSALEHASDNDTVFVQNGTYYEHVVVNKSLSLVGENRSNTVIDGEGTGNVVEITVNSVTLERFTIRNGTYGVHAVSSCSNHVNENAILENQFGILLSMHSSCNRIIGNIVLENDYGIYLIGEYPTVPAENTIYHNSFVHNKIHADISVSRANLWDSGYPSGGNYWRDYPGVDIKSGRNQNETGSDGIRDTSYVIDADNIDNYPLMGMFSDFIATSEYHAQTVCNSSISDFGFNGTSIGFNVTGDDGTMGFCRICIPKALMNETYQVYVNGTEVQYTPLLCSNTTHSYIYFTYNHSTQEVVIIPEFPSLIILSLFIMTTLLAVIVCRRNSMKNRLKVLRNVS